MRSMSLENLNTRTKTNPGLRTMMRLNQQQRRSQSWFIAKMIYPMMCLNQCSLKEVLIAKKQKQQLMRGSMYLAGEEKGAVMEALLL